MRRAAAIVLLGVALSGCAGDPITEIFACYAADEGFATTARDLELCVRADDPLRPPLYGCDGAAAATTADLPLTHGIVQRTASTIAIEIASTVPSDDGPALRVRQAAVVPFVGGRIVDVVLTLERACIGIDCAEGETCVDGRCRPVEVAYECLRDHGAANRPGCDDSRVTRRCD